jgi:hypothetical protein
MLYASESKVTIISYLLIVVQVNTAQNLLVENPEPEPPPALLPGFGVVVVGLVPDSKSKTTRLGYTSTY